jgi:hypothetical protein
MLLPLQEVNVLLSRLLTAVVPMQLLSYNIAALPSLYVEHSRILITGVTLE